MGVTSYLAVTYEALPETHDVLVAEAWSAGVLGCQVNDHQVVAYFAEAGGDPTAAKLGAARCVGLERDLTAALIGGLNRSLNRVSNEVALIVGGAEVLRAVPWVDLLLINIRPPDWLPCAASLRACLAPGAEAVCSGFLDSEVEDLQMEFEAMDWRPVEWLSENEWGASLLRVGPA